MATPKLPIWAYSHSSSQNSGLGVKNQNQPQSIVRSNLSMPYFFSVLVDHAHNLGAGEQARGTWSRWRPARSSMPGDV